MEHRHKCLVCTKPCQFRNWFGIELNDHSKDSASFFEADVGIKASDEKRTSDILILPPMPNFVQNLDELDYSH